MIALHFATSPDAAQLFPSCSQIRITGSFNATMSAVTSGVPAHFPGAYKDTDPGIHVPKVRNLNIQHLLELLISTFPFY